MSKHSIFKDPVGMVANGLAVWEWKDIYICHPAVQETLCVRVMKDAMKLPDENGKLVRFCVTAAQQQRIADLVGGIFHSEKTADDRHRLADTQFEPVIRVDGDICALAMDNRCSELVDDAIAQVVPDGDPGIVSSVGKPWTLTNNMVASQRRHGDRTAFNYGWYSKSAPARSKSGLRLWQPIIWANAGPVHSDDHHDPSQVCEFPFNKCQLEYADGQVADTTLEAMYQHHELWKLVCYGGPLKVVRQLSVPRPAQLHFVFAPDGITAGSASSNGNS